MVDQQEQLDKEAIEKARKALVAFAVAQLIKRASEIVWLSWLTWPGVGVITEIALNRLLSALSKRIGKIKDDPAHPEKPELDKVERQAKLAFSRPPV